jgi:hypothetical protein
MPGDFHARYARVEPRNRSAFEYAYINKKGEVVFKQTADDIKKYGTFKNFHDFGMAFSGGYFLITELKIIPLKDFFTSYGIPADSRFFNRQLTEMAGEKIPNYFLVHAKEWIQSQGRVLLQNLLTLRQKK